MISGFQAKIAIDDGGNGGAPGGVSTEFAGLITIELPEFAAEMFDGTELNQKDGANADPYMREFPTGLIKQGASACEIKFTKANYQRLLAILARGRTAGYVIVLTAPDDWTNPGTPVVLTATMKGTVSKVGRTRLTKTDGVVIPFELSWSDNPVLS